MSTTNAALPTLLAAPVVPSPSPSDPSMPDGLLPRFILDPNKFMSEFYQDVFNALMSVGKVVLPVIAGGAVLFIVVRLALVLLRARRMRRGGAGYIAILPPPDVDPKGATSLWRNLEGQLATGRVRSLIAGRPHVSFELTWSASGVGFGIWIPPFVSVTKVEQAVQAAWPGAATSSGEPGPALPLDALCVGGELRLSQPEWFPILSDHPCDPYRMLLGAASGLGPDDAAAVHILARPASGRRMNRCYQAAQSLRTGGPVRFKLLSNLVNDLLDIIQPGPPAKPFASSNDPRIASDIRLIQDKAAQGSSWEVSVRYGVATHAGGKHQRKRLRSHAHAITASFAMYSSRNRLVPKRICKPAAVMASRRLGKGNLLSVPELVGLAHLPLDIGVPGLVRAGARSLAPPIMIPQLGKVLGDSQAGPRRSVALDPVDARHHLHIVGATGTGKSTLLTNLVLGDVAAGRGAVVIDPKGDLINDILDRLPASALGKVVLIDPAETEAPPAMNVLEGEDPRLAVENLVGIFRRIFASTWGPRTDDVLRMACLTLIGRPGATLTDVPRLIDDPDSYDTLSSSAQNNLVGSVMYKLRWILSRPFISDIVGSSSSSFDMATDVLDGGLLLVRLPKGILGDETSKLLGSFIVAKVWQTITARSRAGEVARAEASLYVDECQNFLNLPRSFEEMLAEARGYRLSVVCAHQHLSQLPTELRDSVSANARNKIFFKHLIRRRPGSQASFCTRA